MATEMLDDAEFENQMGNMTDRQLSEFTARQVLKICKDCVRHDKRIRLLEAIDRRMLIVGGLIGASGVGLTEAGVRLWKILTGS